MARSRPPKHNALWQFARHRLELPTGNLAVSCQNGGSFLSHHGIPGSLPACLVALTANHFTHLLREEVAQVEHRGAVVGGRPSGQVVQHQPLAARSQCICLFVTLHGRRVLHGIARKCNTRASGALADDALHPLRVSVRRSHLCRHVACHLAQQINARLAHRPVAVLQTLRSAENGDKAHKQRGRGRPVRQVQHGEHVHHHHLYQGAHVVLRV
mmetsp:Transcript_19248/g.49408  ORF Transcript_19248/g.49408 Transcript_19248/m.49408 type:complete len:213 (+) Transcript_19248:2548-3186(+)